MSERLTDERVREIAETYLAAAPICLRDSDGEAVDITEDEIESLAREVLAARAGEREEREVVNYARTNAHRWLDRDDHYWFARLSQEVGELGSSLVGDHDDPPEHELRQIGSIALNWLRKRASRAAPGGETRAEG